MKVSLFLCFAGEQASLGCGRLPLQKRSGRVGEPTPSTTVFRTLTKDALARVERVECGLDSEVGISR